MLMPPFLRLDSTGEVMSDDGPLQSVGHQKVNAYRQTQGTPSSVTNSLLSKMMLQFAPQSKSLLQQSAGPQTVAQGLSALDEIIIRSQQAVNGVGNAGVRSHVKMAQANQQAPSRYGQWGIMNPSCLWQLPPGVFPCHVFRAAQSQSPLWPPVTGQFVHKGTWPISGCSSTAATGEDMSVQRKPAAYLRCAKAMSNSHIVQDSNGSSSSLPGDFNSSMVSTRTQGQSAGSLLRCGKAGELHQTRTQCDSKTDTYMEKIRSTPRETQSRDVEYRKVDCAARLPCMCSGSISQNRCAENQSTQDKSPVTSGSFSNHEPVSVSIIAVHQEETGAKHPTTPETKHSEVSKSKDDGNTGKETEGENNSIVGACYEEILQEMDSGSSAGSGQELDYEDDDFWADSEDEDAVEMDEDCIQEALCGLPICGLRETIILSRPCKKMQMDQERHDAANRRWNHHYSATVPEKRPRKVRVVYY